MNCREYFSGGRKESHENSSWIRELVGDGGKSGGGEGSYRSVGGI